MRSRRPKRVNVDVAQVMEIECDHGYFVLAFRRWNPGGGETVYRMRMPRWWVNIIGRKFWSYIKREEEDIAAIKKGLRGETE